MGSKGDTELQLAPRLK